MDLPMLVLPTPGGPTKQRIFPCVEPSGCGGGWFLCLGSEMGRGERLGRFVFCELATDETVLRVNSYCINAPLSLETAMNSRMRFLMSCSP